MNAEVQLDGFDVRRQWLSSFAAQRVVIAQKVATY
jgi:hypothetical protein